jgi:hypothetical protein
MSKQRDGYRFNKLNKRDNRSLIERIESKEVDIRTVMSYALDKGLLTRQEYSLMDTTDARRFLVINKVDYKPE